VVLSLHQFSVAPLFLKATDWVATLPARFVGRFAAELDVFPLPFAAGGYSLSAAWHPRFDGDPGHAWLRARLRQIAVCEPDKA
jgi:DNA-binding transcriptional LysR family regulator